MPIGLIKKFFIKNPQEDVPHLIYGRVVAQARNPALFEDFAVQDTVIGRYDMLSLHVFLLNNRLKRQRGEDKSKCSALSQTVFDLFVGDVERGLRDIGFADTSVHKRKKRLIRSYFALIEEFDQALENSRIDRITTAVAKRYFENLPQSEQSSRAKLLASYIVQCAKILATQANGELLSGKLKWPPVT